MTKKTGTKTMATKKTTKTIKPSPKKVAVKAAAPKAVAAKAVPAAPKKPVKSPLNKKEMEPYRAMLLDLKTKLIKDVLMNQEASNESLEGEVLDSADLASDSYDKDLANSLSETERARLVAVEAALERVKQGTYGMCDSCGKPIPLGRLKVLPFAKLCVQCQEDEEKVASRSWTASGGGE
jgi:DnaK suppressor protein